MEAGSAIILRPHISHLDGGLITNKGLPYLSSLCHDRFWLLNMTTGLQLQWPLQEQQLMSLSFVAKMFSYGERGWNV
jgi:hypothetical protein